MDKKFGGFTQTQIDSLFKQLGHTGDGSYNDFLEKNPDKAAKFFSFASKAKNMAEGGLVTDTTTGSQQMVEELQGNAAPQQSQAEKITNKAINNPQKLIDPVEVSKIQIKDSQKIDKNAGDAGKASTANANTVDNTATVKPPQTGDAATYDPTKTGDQVQNVLDNTEAVQGTVSEEAKVEAQTALPSADATVQGQLKKLYESFEGGEVPPWAAGAMRNAEAIMGARGLGASSMAGSAITQAAMESAFQIAVQDAATYSQFEMKNLDNRQQAALVNAQSFLQMDLANLDMEHATNVLKTQSMIQSLFTDQAADNAAKQFNATSENQTQQFFAQLQTQVKQFNASQKNAMKQFNKEQKTAVSMFNAQQKNARDEFNAQNRLIIDQSNAEWRRSIATANNQAANEAARLDAQLASGLTTAAYNNLWQKERDIMAFAFTAAENATQRAHEVVLAKMGDKAASNIASQNRSNALGVAAGTLASKFFESIF